MLDRQCRRGPLQRRGRVARSFGGIGARRAPARKCPGPANRSAIACRPADRLLHRLRPAPLRRLRSPAGSRPAGNATGVPDRVTRRRLRLVERVRPKPCDRRSAAQASCAIAKSVSCSISREPSGWTPLSSTSTPWSIKRQLHFGNPLRLQHVGEQLAAAARPVRTARAEGYGTRACRRCGATSRR